MLTELKQTRQLMVNRTKNMFDDIDSKDILGPITPSEFITFVNQTLEYSYPQVIITGEVSGYKINQKKFVFFDLKDETATVSCFMMLFQQRIPLEDGMLVRVRCQPKLTLKGRFSVTVLEVAPVGEGSLRRLFELLKKRLSSEGLFDEARKRPLPQFPIALGLVSSETAAGAGDFLTILNNRWGGVVVEFANVQVQGDAAPAQIVRAIKYFNQQAHPVDVLVMVRGGGSLEDLWSFNDERVVRAIANSRIPTVVGVGHEEDVSLADLAADVRAATPTHAAQLVVPSKKEFLAQLAALHTHLSQQITHLVDGVVAEYRQQLQFGLDATLQRLRVRIENARQILAAYNPQSALARGYSLIRVGTKLITSIAAVAPGDTIEAEVFDGFVVGKVHDVKEK